MKVDIQKKIVSIFWVYDTRIQNREYRYGHDRKQGFSTQILKFQNIDMESQIWMYHSNLAIFIKFYSFLLGNWNVLSIFFSFAK